MEGDDGRDWFTLWKSCFADTGIRQVMRLLRWRILVDGYKQIESVSDDEAQDACFGFWFYLFLHSSSIVMGDLVGNFVDRHGTGCHR